MDIQDEFVHSIGDHPAWSESYYFNIADPDKKICMVTRMSFRPNDGYADGLCVLFFDNNRILYSFNRRDIKMDDHELNVKHLFYERGEPFKNWRVRYDGPIIDTKDAAHFLVPKEKRPTGWYKMSLLNLQIDFKTMYDPHYAAQGETGHFEQICEGSGQFRIGEEIFQINGYGVRDKSWGPRDWKPLAINTEEKKQEKEKQTPTPFVQWFSMNFGSDLAIGLVSLNTPQGSAIHSTGWYQKEGKTQSIKEIKIQSLYQSNSLMHESARITGLKEDESPITLAYKTISVCPIEFPMADQTTFVLEGFAKFSFEDKDGYGIAEYWHSL